MPITVRELAELVHGRLDGDGDQTIQSARPVSEAGPGDVTFIDDERYGKQLKASPASAAIVGPHFNRNRAGIASEKPISLIEVDDPRGAFLAVMSHLRGASAVRWTGVDPRAFVAPGAKLGSGVAIHPLAYIGEDAVIGDGCVIHPGAVVGARCALGVDVVLHPNVVLYPDVVIGDRSEIHSGCVLGGDGFGYRQVQGRHVKVPQTGTVIVAEDVEIGANCTIDRATFGATVIGAGTKIDNLVMIGHNNQIGRHNILCGQVGIAGSCKTGDYVVMAGQAGIKDHVEIGERAVVGAQAGVHRNVPEGQQVLGAPAIPIREQRRLFQMVARLPELNQQFRELTAEVERLKAALAAVTSDAVEEST